MRQRPIYRKIKALGLNIENLDAQKLVKSAKPMLSVLELHEFGLYSPTIFQALVADFKREQVMSKVQAILDKIKLAGLPLAEVTVRRDGSFIVWPEGKPIEPEDEEL